MPGTIIKKYCFLHSERRHTRRTCLPPTLSKHLHPGGLLLLPGQGDLLEGGGGQQGEGGVAGSREASCNTISSLVCLIIILYSMMNTWKANTTAFPLSKCKMAFKGSLLN